MSALALLCHERGYALRGSDRLNNEQTRMLKEAGIHVYLGDDEEITEGTVVFSGAISPAHPQLLAAKQAGKRLLSRAQLLGMIAEEYPHVIAVAGCHGKTSCTAMLAHVFAAAKLPFTCHIGGEDVFFKNYTRKGDKYLITEACEYQKSLLSLKSECAVLLNIDRDHMDCYQSEDELYETFYEFSKQAKFCIVNDEDDRANKIPHRTSFGLSYGNYTAKNLSRKDGKYFFTAYEDGKALLSVRLNVAGEVYVRNALAAIAVARAYHISAAAIKRGLQSFCGVKRRFETVGRIGGVPVVCDYAHHPREILAALQTANEVAHGNVQVVFQPHTYSRTKDLMGEFSSVLQRTDSPIIYATYPAREEFDRDGSAYVLMGNVPSAIYVQSAEQLKTRLKGALKDKKLILVLGAGDIYEICKQILD